MRKPSSFFLIAAIFLTNCARGQFFITDTVIGAGDTNYDGQDIVALGCTLTVDGPHVFSDVLLGEGAVLTHSGGTNGTGSSGAEGLTVTVKNNLVVDGTSAIRADGLNEFGMGKGVTTNSSYPFGAQNGAQNLYLSGSGGGHTGEGGHSLGGAKGGPAYGQVNELNSFDMGSSGGAGNGPGGPGGGLISLKVEGVVLLDGVISANGGGGTNTGSGGGSGGGIGITANSIIGGGSILANGGMGDPLAGGGGGGGRIVIMCLTNTLTGAISAVGGPGISGGGAGTVYVKMESGPANLTVDNGGLIGTNTPLLQALGCNLTVLHGARVEFWEDVNPASFFLGSNCVLLAPIGTPAPSSEVGLQVGTGALTIEEGAVVMADGRAAIAGNDLATGRSGSVDNVVTGGGGAGFGYGGASATGESGGDVTGQILEGGSSGAGGAGAGQGLGGAGGGSVIITANGPVEIDGVVSAQGDPGAVAGSGGGGGGTITITAQHLAGNGLLSANGGAAAALGGGGGGGSVSINSTSNRFTGTITAFGGAGANYGGAGLILYQTNETRQIIVDNGGHSGTNTPLEGLPGGCDLTIVRGAKGAISSQEPVQNLFIGSNAFAVPFVEEDGGSAAVIAEGSVVIDAGGGIVADGGGYAGGAGLGAGKSLDLPGGLNCGAGGGHGGEGGTAASGAAGGAANDSIIAPESAGSGGGSGTGFPNIGGAGGGFVRLTAQGLVTLNGFISANGNPGMNPLSGGGAGGGVVVQAGGLTGSGSIFANGGAGSLPEGGGGGGGMIVITSGSNSFTGTITAYGGAGNVAGGAGTIYEGPLAGSNFRRDTTLTIDNGGMRGTNTPVEFLGVITGTKFDLQVSGGAIVQAGGGEGLGIGGVGVTVNNLLVESNAVITAAKTLEPTTLSLNASGDVVIAAGGEISADELGYMGGTGPGMGVWNGSGETGGGGGYGGMGGMGAFGAAGGGTYGSSNNPNSYGSGGGTPKGAPFSQGGGMLVMVVKGTLTIDGTVTASGGDAEWPGAGGGSGGGLYVDAESLTGSGLIAANGGAGDLEFGGGGGGGRILVGSPSNTFSGVISVLGGGGFNSGAIGTVVFSTNAVVQPDVKPAGLQLSGGVDPIGGSFNLVWSGSSAMTYQVEWSTNLVDWTPYAAPRAGQDGTMTIAAPCTGPAKFFRIVAGN